MEKKNNDDFCISLFKPLVERSLKLLAEKGEHPFKLALRDDIVRKLDRKGYKNAMRWLRECRNIVEQQIDFTALKTNIL